MRKVFLDDLPKRGKLIDWKNSIGYKVKFIYDELKGEIEILGSYGDCLTLKYKNKDTSMQKDSFKKCHLGFLIGKINKQHKYKIGDIFEKINNGRLKITGLSRSKGYKIYTYQCLKCNNNDNIIESHLDANQGCNVCSGKKVLKGYNDLWTTNHEVAKLLINAEDGHEYTAGSNKRLDFKCLNCGSEIKNRILQSVVRQGLSCPACSDGISYPEKFVFSALTQMGIEFTTQETFNWAKNVIHQNKKLNGDKRYDFYIPHLNLIIETHGAQHYDHGFEGNYLRDERENDTLKESLAKCNGVKNYFVIDCRESELEFLKNSILESRVHHLLDFNDIDWLKCHEYACSSLVKVACDLWEGGLKNATEIGAIMKISSVTAIKYLKQGSVVGWCDYNAEEARIKGGNNARSKRVKKPVFALTMGGKLAQKFENSADAVKKLKISHSSISQALKGKSKSAGGFKWMYKEDYDKSISQTI